MSEEQILHKAITKAIDNGWTPDERLARCIKFDVFFHLLSEVIYNKDFAKAFWSHDTNRRCPWCQDWHTPLETWQYHLQQMVLKEDPIQYLAKFLDTVPGD